jgi:hypothetical protein
MEPFKAGLAVQLQPPPRPAVCSPTTAALPNSLPQMTGDPALYGMRQENSVLSITWS